MNRTSEFLTGRGGAQVPESTSNGDRPERAAKNGLDSGVVREEHTSGAKAHVDSDAVVPGINPWPTARKYFSADREGMKPRNGFTLMELLIVIAIILILMLMAIPTIGSLKKKANETSAINSVQVISKAELQYESTYPSNGFGCTLTALGGDPTSGAPSAASAQILQGDLTSGYKSGYIFTVACKDKVTVNGQDRFNSYVVTAVPQTVGKTGDRGFCSDQFGAIKFDPTGGTNCTQALGQ